MRKPDVLLATAFSAEDTAELDALYTLHRSVPDEGAERIRAVATTGTHGATVELMRRLPGLELVAVFGVGFDAVDLDHARARGIRVTNTPDVLTDGVAEMAMALMLAVARRIPEGDRWVRESRWLDGPTPLGVLLKGRRLGVFGLGRIGLAVAERASAFGMTILYTARAPRTAVPYAWRPDARALAHDSDILILCAAGGEATRGVIDRAVLEALGPSGVLINVARGSLVDEPALLSSLRSGALAGAGLDVFWDEPHIDPGFRELETVVLQPHNGSATVETRAAIGALMRANLAAHFAGEPLPTPVL